MLVTAHHCVTSRPLHCFPTAQLGGELRGGHVPSPFGSSDVRKASIHLMSSQSLEQFLAHSKWEKERWGLWQNTHTQPVTEVHPPGS